MVKSNEEVLKREAIQNSSLLNESYERIIGQLTRYK